MIKHYFLLVILASAWSLHAQTFVDVSATGTGDGTSWTDAYTDLQQAIFDASSGDEIWVSQGSYIPTIDEAGALPTNLRLRHFWLKDGVAVYGGFNGTEIDFTQRDVITQQATLEGQVDASNQAFHVINTTAGSTAKLDGFIVQNGNTTGGTVAGVSESGAGLLLIGDAQFFNITFRNNVAYSSAGGAYLVNSSTILVNCHFEGNSTTLYDGGALYIQNSTVTLYNCVLFNNTANRFGGALTAVNSTVNLQNASIANNTGTNVYQASTNATINNNQSTLWGNTAAIGIDSGGGSSVNFSECVYQWAATGTNINSDPLFVNIATGDLRLTSASPAIDGVTLAPYNPYRDIDGNNRIAGSAMDMGAYEYGSVSGQLLYVDKDATGANNGSSWADAFNTLEDALAIATFTQGEEIWIADGTYTPHASDRNALWLVPNSMKLYGGFNGTETNRAARDPQTNVVRLSGDLNGDDNGNIDHTEATRQDNSYHLFRVTGPKSNIFIDGVTMADANANGTGNELTAPVLITFHSGADHLIQVSFNDVVVEKNTAINAAIYQNFHYFTQGGTTIVNFSHSTIRDNISTSTLGNIQYTGHRTQNQKNYGTIDNCEFYGNGCTNSTGAATIYNTVTAGSGIVAPMTVTNNTFTKNNIGSGYAIAVGRSGDSRYINNIFYDNGTASPILWVNSGVVSSVFQNCISEDPLFGINQAPLFRDAANNDFRIDCSGLSPAIDGGSSLNATIAENDFAGLPRTVDIVDIGAHEFQAGMSIDATATSLCPNESVTLTASNGTGLSWTGGVTNGAAFIPTATTTYTVSGTTSNGCVENESIQVEVIDIQDFTTSTSTPSFCTSGSATVDLSGSSTDNTYTLVEDGTGTILDGPITGTGNPLSFNTGVLTSTTTVNVIGSKQVSVNNAFDYDGSGDYVSLTAGNRGITSTMTVSLRVKATVTGATQWLAVKYDVSNGFLLFINPTGKASLDGRDGSGGYKSSGPSTTTVADGQWHEITGVVSSTGWHIYVDGVLENTGAYALGTGGLATAANLTVGAYAGQFSPFDIDQLTLWNTALDATGVANILTTCYTGQETDVVGHFDFDETSGSVLADYSSSATDGIIYGFDPTTQSIPGSINACTESCLKTMPSPITITISDIVAPVADIASLPNVTDPCSIASLMAPMATDNCSGAIAGTSNASFPITASTTITWTYDDGNGNSSSQTQDVVINDNIAPTLDIASLPALNAQCEITSLTPPTATDNCVGALTGTHNVSLPISSNTTITWTYDDGNGNTATQTQAVVINDNIAPVADLATLSNLTAQCEVTALTAPTATDNCSASVTVTNNATLPISSNTTITWTYDDGNGNTSTQTQAVVINDNVAPVADVATLSNLMAQCEITALTAPTATDNCSGSVTVTNNASLPISSNTTITWTYDDGNGNTSTQTQNVVLNDVTAPVANLGSLADLTAQCEITSLTPPSATDNCAGAITGTHNASLPISSNTTITWTYDDGDGNTSTQTQNVVISDVTAPIANVGSLPTITDECSVTSLSAPTATDNCAGTITATHNATLPISTNTTITWTYTDPSGNTSNQTQSVVINDVTAPIPDLTTLADVTAQCSVTSLSNPSATDNCSAVLISSNAVLPILTNTTITWTYTDVDGNQSTQTQNVVINDNTAPVADIAALSDLTAQCEITALTAPNATDNCDGGIIGTHNATLPITTSGVVVWTYTDASGNSSTQNQNVLINDNTVPVPDMATLSDVTSQCELVSLTAPTATDNCSATVTVTNNATLPISASTTVTWTYDDGNGNTTTQNQNVVINDQTNPVPDVAQLASLDAQCEVTSLLPPTATDNCSGTITGTNNASFPITTNTLVTWAFTDNSGNTVTQDQQINIDDTMDPQPDLASLSDVTETCEVTSLIAPTATDNCAGTITATSNATYPITSSTIVTWTYDDGNGNTVTQDQNVVINGVDATTVTINFTITANEPNADSYQWVDCNNGNAPIAGETSASFTATLNGSYAVEVTIGNCTETSGCETFTTIGMDELPIENLNIYPNPTNNFLYVQTEAKIQELRVLDLTGALVSIVRNEFVDVSQFATGSYILEIQTETATYRKAFVVSQ